MRFFLQAYKVENRELPPFSILSGRYLTGKVLGKGGFGITYIGWDLYQNRKIAIKEFYVQERRDQRNDSGITAYTGSMKTEQVYGVKDNLKEAENLALFFTLPGVVSVRDFFYENGTAYMVMEYIEGKTLREYLDLCGGSFLVGTALELLYPVAEALSVIHQAGIIHRDVSPDNIMVSVHSDIKLIDFGAARRNDYHERQIQVVLRSGYAPIEQYTFDGVQGPWTDVYAYCATLYKVMTGTKPQDAVERSRHDRLVSPSVLGVRLPPGIEHAMMGGLQLYREQRIQSMQQLIQGLFYNRGKSWQPQSGSPAADVEDTLTAGQVQSVLDKVQGREVETAKTKKEDYLWKFWNYFREDR